MNDARELFGGYSPDLKTHFLPFIEKANEFVEKNQFTLATLYTSPENMQTYANELVVLATPLVETLKTIGQQKFSFYRSLLLPPVETAKKLGKETMQGSVSDTAGIEGPGKVDHGGTCYYIFEKVLSGIGQVANHPRALLVMLQHLPKGKNTGNEIHGVKIDGNTLLATKGIGGMELHIPLLDNTIFFNNGNEIRPNPNEAVLTLPGDQHSLVRQTGNAINMIIMAYGAGLGAKVNPKMVEQGVWGLGSSPVPLPLTKYSQISRHITFK